MKKSHGKIFIEYFELWRKRLKIKEIPISRDNRLNCTACVVEDKELRYNSRILGQSSIPIIISDALHELGHLIHKYPYGTEANKIISEYEAEKFAVKIMKQYYQKELKDVIIWMKRKLLKKNHKYWKSLPEHYEAFRMIEEYKDKD